MLRNTSDFKLNRPHLCCGSLLAMHSGLLRLKMGLEIGLLLLKLGQLLSDLSLVDLKAQTKFSNSFFTCMS